VNKVDYHIRDATLGDISTLFAIYAKVLKVHIDKIWGWNDIWQEKDFRDHYNINQIRIIVVGDKAIGYIQTRTESNYLFIRMFVITPEFQGHGIGGNVLTNIIQSSLKKNQALELIVFKVNVKAINFYKKIGFTIIAETETHFRMRYNPTRS
jgi:ribosomal protein S18 acetylase RimI-like enzyme